MFYNSGHKIKVLAVILFIVCIIATLVLAIATSIIRDRYGNADGFRFWQFLGILVGGGLTSFISSLFLYAFGDLVEDVSILRSCVSDIKKKLIQTDTASPTTHSTNRFCPNCGLTINNPNIHVCPKCSTYVE